MTTITNIFVLLVKTIDAWIVGDAVKLSELWSIKALIANFLLLFRGWPRLSVIGYDNPLWYLCILIQCYLVFYAVRIACGWVSRRVRWSEESIELMVWILIIILASASRNIIAYETYRGLQSFGIGLILCPAFLWVENIIVYMRSSKKHGIIAVLCIIAAGTTVLTCMNVPLQREVLIVGLLTPILTMAFICRDLESNMAPLLGKTSFEVFIWHAPLMAFTKLVFHLTGVQSFPHSYLTMIIFTILIELWAWLMYIKVEMPIANRMREKSTDK